MTAFISENLGTIFSALIVLGIIAAIIAVMIRDKKKGKCAGCAGCDYSAQGASSCKKK